MGTKFGTSVLSVLLSTHCFPSRNERKTVPVGNSSTLPNHRHVILEGITANTVVGYKN